MCSYRQPNLDGVTSQLKSWLQPLSLTCALVILLTRLTLSQNTEASSASPDFDKEVYPLLKARCLDCHGKDTQESKLRLDSMLGVLRGGDSGETIVAPGDSARSHLIERVTTKDRKLRMPPDSESLSESEISVLTAWVNNKAAWQPSQLELSQTKSQHWSFQALARPKLPDNPSHPIDAFIDQQLKASRLERSPMAARSQLLRRLYMVMHGVPPTPDQVVAFENDQQPDAWEKQVDAVLASPRYGERWATHWLDIIHFGETNGYETNRERPHAYQFRDWVIGSFNQDKPYNQFIQHQLAGDAFDEPLGTGFLVAGPNDIVKGQDPLLGLVQRQDELTDIVNTVGTAFLGLTTGCARCHNHKFDPITQSDFYSLQAIFAGVEHGDRELPPTANTFAQREVIEAEMEQLRASLSKYKTLKREPVNARLNVEQFEPILAKFIRFTILETNSGEPCIDELEVYSRDKNVALSSTGAIATSSGDFVHPLHKLSQLNDGEIGNSRSWICSVRSQGWTQIELPDATTIDRILWGRDREEKFKDRLATEYRIETSTDAQAWKLVASSEDRQPFSGQTKLELQYNLADLPAAESARANELLQKLQSLEKSKAELQENSKAYVGLFRSPPVVVRLFRGDPTAPREEVEPGTIASLGVLDLSNQSAELDRRKKLAEWITNARNPLTARVMANRLWQFHFGTGLVDTPSDFGANGTSPSHPELLDWLAAELIERGWSLKHLHKVILTSQTWQQDSRPRPEGIQVDASTRALWRFPPRRLEAEAIRDSILSVSGQIDWQMAGPGFSAFEIEFENVRHYFPKKDYGPADWRRMIYMTKVRQEKDSTFGLFDCPDGSQVTPKRSRSTTPLQALNLLNSRFVLQQAEALAARLRRESDKNEQQVDRAFQLCFSRGAAPEELAASIEFIQNWGLMQFARAMLNTNEFVFIQ